jgi:hypothetical protein
MMTIPSPIQGEMVNITAMEKTRLIVLCMTCMVLRQQSKIPVSGLPDIFWKSSWVFCCSKEAYSSSVSRLAMSGAIRSMSFILARSIW